MKGNPEERAVILGKFIIENEATVRSTAKIFGISKSTVHKDVTTRLEKHNHALYEAVRSVLETNLQERHVRGGAATQKKYAKVLPAETPVNKKATAPKLATPAVPSKVANAVEMATLVESPQKAKTKKIAKTLETATPVVPPQKAKAPKPPKKKA